MTYPKILYRYPGSAGKPFRPANGTEGDVFMDAFCKRCEHEDFIHTNDVTTKQCPILSKCLIFNSNNPEYPKELVFDENGWPKCTNWKLREWNDSLQELDVPPVSDPAQTGLWDEIERDSRSLMTEVYEPKKERLTDVEFGVSDT